jgi:hypothetical protein
MSKNRFLYAAVSATDSISLPSDKVLGMESTDTESLKIHFAGLGTDDNQGFIDLEIKSGGVKAACKAIVHAINYGTEPFIVLQDGVDDVTLDSNIEDVTAISL